MPTKGVKSDDPDKEIEDVANDEIEHFNDTTGKWPPSIF